MLVFLFFEIHAFIKVSTLRRIGNTLACAYLVTAFFSPFLGRALTARERAGKLSDRDQDAALEPDEARS
jgi:hypothetical protein